MENIMIKACIMWENAKRVVTNERGQSMVEYAVLVAAIAVIAIGIFATDTGLAKSLKDMFARVAQNIDKAVTAPK